MIHCCLYFIAPHRLKHIDLAFMRRLHKYVNIVPIIAKSDTMTTKEKEEFKLQAHSKYSHSKYSQEKAGVQAAGARTHAQCTLHTHMHCSCAARAYSLWHYSLWQVREALISSGVELFPFDLDVVRAMEQQDKQEYKPPWAVVGSTDAYLEAGLTVYQRKYPWGNALSSEPAHSDLPALRNLVMWSGQWQELKLSTRAKYEVWRAERGLLADASTSIGRGCHAAAGRLAVAGRAVADGYRCACRVLRLPPRVTLAALLLLLLAAAGATVASAAQTKWAAERSASHKLDLLREQVRPRSAGNLALALTLTPTTDH